MAFDNAKYLKLQIEEIKKRLAHPNQNRLYLEIGGQLAYDGHASRVLPGFDPENKIKIIKALDQDYDLIYCISYDDIVDNKALSEKETDYGSDVMRRIETLESMLKHKVILAINKVPRQSISPKFPLFLDKLEKLNYKYFLRYFIPGFPEELSTILSAKGFGNDQFIQVKSNLVIATGAASNSGKLSTCLGQIYNETQIGQNPGYAKYELFPIWNLPLNHPVNLAYEAATADIGDYNLEDRFHLAKYGEKALNYNRDVEAYELLKKLSSEFVKENSLIRTYYSPTDMGINHAGFCITDPEAVVKAGIEEISRRKEEYLTLAKKPKIFRSGFIM